MKGTNSTKIVNVGGEKIGICLTFNVNGFHKDEKILFSLTQFAQIQFHPNINFKLKFELIQELTQPFTS